VTGGPGRTVLRRDGPGKVRHQPVGRPRVSNSKKSLFRLKALRLPAADVPGNPVADRPAAGAAGAGMTSAGGRCNKRRQPRCALMRAEQHVSVPRCGQLAVLTACRARGATFRPGSRPCGGKTGSPFNKLPVVAEAERSASALRRQATNLTSGAESSDRKTWRNLSQAHRPAVNDLGYRRPGPLKFKAAQSEGFRAFEGIENLIKPDIAAAIGGPENLSKSVSKPDAARRRYTSRPAHGSPKQHTSNGKL
jgi:hypothetical protein